MKYAVINKDRKYILRVSETEPSFTGESFETVEISEALYNEYNTRRETERHMYLVDGEILSREQNLKRVRMLREEERFNENPQAYKEFLAEVVRRKRWETEQGGFEFSGLTIPSDDRSQMLINGAFNAAKEDASFVTKWQVGPLNFVDLDADAVIALGHALRDHVNSVFLWQAAKVQEIIEAETFEDIKNININD